MKCSMYSCTTGKKAMWQPVVLLWPEGAHQGSCHPATLTLHDIFICADCKETTKPFHFFDEIQWQKVKREFLYQNKRIPTLKTAKLQFFIPDSLPAIEGIGG